MIGRWFVDAQDTTPHLGGIFAVRAGMTSLKQLGSSRYVLDILAILFLIVLFSILEFRHLHHPGLYGDEAWGAVPSVRFSLGRPVIDAAPFRQFEIFGYSFPFMANYYTGPIKTYILAVAFYLFGTSVDTLRVTMGLVGLTAVIGLFLALRTEFGRLTAFCAGILLATDLSYVLLVRGDWPPFAFAAVARTFSLYFLIGWWRRVGHLYMLFAGMLVLGLGLTHKADFFKFSRRNFPSLPGNELR